MKQYLLSAFAIVALLFAACGGGDDAPTTVPVSGIKLDKSSLSLEIGEKATLTATIAPSDATNKSITWSSANSSIATVNNGVVEGVATGETTITAKTNDGGFTATIPVKVVSEEVAVTGISITYIRLINVGQEGTITVCFSPNNATNTNATITLSDPDVLSIEYKGNNQNPMLPSSWPCYTIKGLKAGNCTIKAVSEDGGFEYECTVTVMKGEKPTNITVDGKNSVKLLTWHGKKLEIVPDMTPINADLSTLTWTMNDWKTQNPCTSKIEAKKITVESNLSHYPYQFESVLNGTTIYGNNDRFDFTVYFRTHAIFSNHFEETKKRIDLSLPNTSIQISADLVELPYNVNAGTLYFEAYCPPIEYYASASPMWAQFPEAYIPTSEYTLTSSDETKWKVTKVSESTYKIEDLAPSTYKEIDLTYTCGEFSFTRKFKVVPK
jgi:uncharacterized protein YjdB